jgi:hypothetical protein
MDMLLWLRAMLIFEPALIRASAMRLLRAPAAALSWLQPR